MTQRSNEPDPNTLLYVGMARIEEKQANILKELTELKTGIVGQYATKAELNDLRTELWPVRSLVYGTATIILIAFIGALVLLVQK